MYDMAYLRRQRPGWAAAVVISSMALPASAADWSQHSAFGLDLGVGSVISRYSPNAQDGGGLIFTGLRANYDVSDELSLQLGLRLWSLPGANQATMPSLGARLEPFRNEFGRAFVDAALGIVWTNDATTFGFDVGAGFELDLPMVPGFSIGPAFRYGEVVDPAPLNHGDGRAWQLGFSATYHLGRAEAGAAAARKLNPQGAVRPFVFKVSDTDHDGVTDDADQCPEVPAGRHPDPFRPGCPENDEDQDGVPDSIDDCPLTPAGPRPDHARRGCPFVDTDHDGIPDADDQCPDKAGPASRDPAKNGCPDPRKAAPKRPALESSPAEALPPPSAVPKSGVSRPRSP
jgi:opacity protein-like surface antigen